MKAPNNQNSLFAGKQEDKYTKLNHFLKAVPHLQFSEKGIENISNRFDVTPERLLAIIADIKKGGDHAK